MVERGQDFGFALETGQPLGVVHEGVGQDLQGDIAVQLGVAGLIDFAHAAGANGGDDFIDAERGAGFERHVGNGEL